MQTNNKNTILLVEDNSASRDAFYAVLSGGYNMVLAESGRRALEMLETAGRSISCILLDLELSGMSAWDTLQSLSADERYNTIPVIAASAELDDKAEARAMRAGARAFVGKGQDGDVLIAHIENAIFFRENFLSLEERNLSDRDPKSGIWNKEHFYRRIRHEIDMHPGQQYCLVRFDLDRFKVFNDIFGVNEGDKLLHFVGDALKAHHPASALYAHIEADHFALFIARRENVNAAEHYALLKRYISEYPADFDFSLKAGIYEIDDPAADPGNMCDRALLALKTTKDSATKVIGWYDKELRDTLLMEQELVSEIKQALEKREFEVYYQPQFNYSTGDMIGAEALVRWNHPKHGILSPALFIPAMEKNGLVSQLDEFVWEQCCRQLKQWRDMEGEFDRLSISVSTNISRIDIYRSDLCDYICSLVDRYGIPHDLLKLEITESAYMNNPDQLIGTVSALQRAGFQIEMDDFGSGYSSLNTLKDVPVDILKLDMKFLTESQHSPRGGSILSSVIRMARWLKLPVIAEGVETKEQADYLKSIGCMYMQGYYFARPMTAAAFEELVCMSSVGSPDKYRKIDTSEVEQFWDADNRAALIFNSFVGGAAIIEYDGVDAEMVQVNDRFLEIVNATREEYEPLMMQVRDRLAGKYRALFTDMLAKAAETGAEVTGELCSKPINGNEYIWTNCRVRLLSRNVGSDMFFLALEDTTAKKKAQDELQKQKTFLQALYDTVPNGVMLYDVVKESIRLRACNEQAWHIMGYDTREAFAKSYDVGIVNDTIYDADRERVTATVQELIGGKQKRVDSTYRIKTRDGGFRWIRVVAERNRFRDGTDVIECVVIDVTEQKKVQTDSYGRALIAAYDEVTLFDLADDTLTLLRSKITDKSTGVTHHNGAQVTERWINNVIHPDCREAVRCWLKSWQDGEAFERDNLPAIEYRAQKGDGIYLWTRSFAIQLESDRYLVCNKDITALRRAAEAEKDNALLYAQIGFKHVIDEQRIILLKHFGITSGSYFPREDVFEYSRLDKNGEPTIILLENYLKNERRLSVSEESAAAFRAAVAEATKKPTVGVIDFRGDFTGGGEAMYRMRYASVAGSGGEVDRLVGLVCSAQISYDTQALSLDFSDQFGIAGAEENQGSMIIQLLDVLNSTMDPSSAIDTILRIVGSNFDMSRAYVIHDDDANPGWLEVKNTWYAQGAPLHKLELTSSINSPEFINCLGDRLDIDGQFRCNDTSLLPEAGRDVYEKNCVYAVMVCVIPLANGRHGYLCFDECRRPRVWMELRRTLFSIVSRFIGSLISKESFIASDPSTRTYTTGFKQSLSFDSGSALGHSVYHDILLECGVTVLEWKRETGTLGYTDGYLGYELSQHDYHKLYRKRGDELCHPDDYGKLSALFSAGSGNDKLFHDSIRLRTTGGEYRMTEIMAAFECDEDGTLKHVFVHMTDVERTHAEAAALSSRAAMYESTIGALPVGIAVCELRGGKAYPTYLSDSAAELFGFAPNEYAERILAGEPSFFTPDEQEASAIAANAKNGIFSGCIGASRRDGTKFHLRFMAKLVPDKDRKVVYAILSDCACRTDADKEARWQLERYKLLTESLNVMTYDYDPKSDTMSYTVSRPGGTLEQREEKNYISRFWQMTKMHPDSREGYITALKDAAATPGTGSLDYQMDYSGSGKYHWYHTDYVSIAGDDGRVFRVVGKVESIDEEKARLITLELRAETDGTTGLMNKDTAGINIENLLLQKPQDRMDALMLIDLDDFKRVNDTFGHVEGDNLLRTFAEKLKSIVPAGDLAARFGGDEFVVYLHSVGSEQNVVSCAESILTAARKLMPERFGEVGCSIGIAPIQRRRLALTTILGQADYALYASKRRGKHCWTMFNAATMNENADLLGGFTELR